MSTILRPTTELPPEWRRSGPFLLIAVALHATALAMPIAKVLFGPETEHNEPLSVRLAEPKPVGRTQTSATTSVPSAALTHQPVRHEPPRPQATVAPVIALSAPSASPSSVVAAPAGADNGGSASVAPAAISATPARFDVAYLQNPKPNYPSISRRLGEEGKVLLRVRVSPEGLPTAIELEKGSNYERLDEAARQVVGRWRFVPARRGEQSVESSVIVPIVFRLDG